MTAIPDLGSLLNRMTGGNSGAPEHILFWKAPTIAGSAPAVPVPGVPWSMWLLDGMPGQPTTAPGNTPTAPTAATAGGLLQTNPAGGRQKWLTGFEAYSNQTGIIILYDRLYHQSGMSGTVTNPQSAQGSVNAGTVTVTAATPGVVSFASHGFGIGQRVRFSTTTTLPGGLTAGVDYYVSATSYAANTFVVSDTRAHALAGTNNITTSTTGTGTHTCTGQADGTLTRYTDGAGNFAFVEVYTAVGTTPQTVTASYTDQDGNTGNTSGTAQLGGTLTAVPGRQCTTSQFPFASGDTGLRSVQSVTLSGSTLTAGDFGVTIGHELARIHVFKAQGGGARDGISPWPAQLEVKTDACLALLWVPIANTIPAMVGAVHMIDY